MSDQPLDMLEEDDGEPAPSFTAPEPAVPKNTARSSKSDKDFEERLEFTAYLLGQMLPKGKIKKILVEKYKVSARTTETYLARAREKLVEWSHKPRSEHHLEAVSYYMAVIQNPSAPLRDKMIARQRLDGLFGLEPPKEHKVMGDKSQPIVVTIQDIVAAREQAVRWRHERFGADDGGNPAPAALERQE